MAPRCQSCHWPGGVRMCARQSLQCQVYQWLVDRLVWMCACWAIVVIVPEHECGIVDQSLCWRWSAGSGEGGERCRLLLSWSWWRCLHGMKVALIPDARPRRSLAFPKPCPVTAFIETARCSMLRYFKLFSGMITLVLVRLLLRWARKMNFISRKKGVIKII